MTEKRCESYCGVSCVDGSCPVANRDEYAERGYDVIFDCDECWHYEGCKDCCFEGTEMCPELNKNENNEGDENNA